ncbi:MAG: class I SAM-dependent methyltransferase [Thermodesulfobacteriota bacterium]
MDKQNKEEAVRAHWEDPATVSLADQNLRALETDAIKAFIPPGKTLLDVGCGDGCNTVEYAAIAGETLGVDYSHEMIARAKCRLAAWQGARLEFRRLELDGVAGLNRSFHTVITQRCLINLGDFAAQTAAIRAIHDLLLPGGVFLLLECVDQGRESLNQLREKAGLPPIAMPWHNTFFDQEPLEAFLAGLFTIRTVVDFSLYYLLTRVMNPMTGLAHDDPWSKRLDDTARRLQGIFGQERLQGIGPQRLYVLDKPAGAL